MVLNIDLKCFKVLENDQWLLMGMDFHISVTFIR